jgi:putative toxin-antitoxin system antitoxin component (TIGR02293 family)
MKDMKSVVAYLSTLKFLGARTPVGPEVGERVPLDPNAVPFESVGRLASRLGLEPVEILSIMGMAERTAARRKHEGSLRPDEADRLLRIAYTVEEAERVFGSSAKAAVWLKTPHPLLDQIRPVDLLSSDAGTNEVRDELGRIDYGDFA